MSPVLVEKNALYSMSFFCKGKKELKIKCTVLKTMVHKTSKYKKHRPGKGDRLSFQPEEDQET